MPIYGYACTHCEHTLDALQKMSDEPLVDCPECGKPALRRQLSAPRFRLKGQGWYETDFKSDNQRNIAGEKEASKEKDKSDGRKDAKPADTKSDKKSGKKSDTKPETKSKSSGSKSSAA